MEKCIQCGILHSGVFEDHITGKSTPMKFCCDCLFTPDRFYQSILHANRSAKNKTGQPLLHN